MSIRIPSHLYRNRCGMFYFRLVIPSRLRDTAARRELRFSLQTERREEATLAALTYIADLPSLFKALEAMTDEDKDTRERLLRNWMQEKRKSVALLQRVEELEVELMDAKDRLKAVVPLEKAQRAVRRAHQVGRLRGRIEVEDRLVFPWPPERTEAFSALVAAYLRSLSARPASGAKKPPTSKTLDDYRRTFEEFILVMTDLQIGLIDRDVAEEYFLTLKKLPANLSRRAELHGKAIGEILALGLEGQTESNASKKMGRLAALFGWALLEKRKWGIDANPFTGFAQASNAKTARRPFTIEELTRLLSHPDYTSRRFGMSYSYWLIPLALFTGARLGELAQLDLKDFVEVEGVPCLDINDESALGADLAGSRQKHVKTDNAKRLVPIHSELIRIGLLRHVEKMRARGAIHLFPELSRERRDGPGHAASNWFQRFRKVVGLTRKQETVFHSFRHLFITTILDSGAVSPYMLAPLVGHEADLLTGTVYWNKKDALARRPAVEAMRLPESVLALIPVVEQISVTNAPGRRRAALQP